MQDIFEPTVEQQHGEAVHQRPGARDRGGLLQGQRLLRDMLMAAGGNRLRKAAEGGLGGFIQRRPE